MGELDPSMFELDPSTFELDPSMFEFETTDGLEIEMLDGLDFEMTDIPLDEPIDFSDMITGGASDFAPLMEATGMSAIFIGLMVVFIVGCIALICAILLQKKRSAGGIGSIAGMGNVADTYWDKNKKRSAEGALEKYTKIGAALLAILAVVLCLPIF